MATKLEKLHRYGWRADMPDKRDKLYKKVMKPMKLPPLIDLRQFCSPIEDQGQLGSCTANALVGNLEFLEVKDKVQLEKLSRLFLYYNERVIENTVFSDSGAELRDGIKALVKWGNCSEQCWNYDISKFSETPPDICFNEAIKHKVTSYLRIVNLQEMQTCLASGYPFVFGFGVYESFETIEVASTGIVPMPDPDEELLGGHAVCAVGYDSNKKIFPESKGSFLIRNSWGIDWGIKGYFYMPFEYLSNRDLSEDFWTIRKEEGF